MDSISVLTLRLAEAIGLYMIVIGLGALLAPSRWKAAMDDLDRSPGLVLVLGFTTVVAGTALVLVHHQLSDLLAAIVTVIGHVALLEGALLLVLPGPLLKLGRATLPFTRVWAIVAIILGLFLFLAGLTGRATVIA